MGERPGRLYRALGAAAAPISRFVFRTRWRGAEHVPSTGGAVVAANHLSNLDPFVLALGVHPRRSFTFMAKAELFRPPLRSMLRSLDVFPVERGASDRTALVTALQLVRSGRLLLMFPAGTRRGKGSRKHVAAEAHGGAARIALRGGVPLIPAALKGTDRLSRLGPLAVVYGEPVELSDLVTLDRRQAAAVATERLMQAIDALERSL